MYTPIGCLTAREIRAFHAEALVHIASSASFIVPFPRVPESFTERPILQTKLVGLHPSQQIVAHTDPAIAGLRYHIPLQTNPGCWAFSGGEWQQLGEGLIYQMDPTVLHGAVNWGTEVRLHLMIDVGA